jgi:hypothetical protein
MHLLPISLLTILAGALLLAKFKKETAGKCLTSIAWFFVAVGFILFIGFIAGGICKIKHHGLGRHHDCRQEMMMKECNPVMHAGQCCPEGMEKEGICCPKGPGRGICPPQPGCMPHDSVMKCCPGHMEKDSVKTPVLKK